MGWADGLTWAHNVFLRFVQRIGHFREIIPNLTFGVAAMGWDVSEIASLNSAKFKFNIYSDTMEDFLFQDDIDDTTITVLVSPSTQNPKLSLKCGGSCHH